MTRPDIVSEIKARAHLDAFDFNTAEGQAALTFTDQRGNIDSLHPTL